jgi:hypothetical protein
MELRGIDKPKRNAMLEASKVVGTSPLKLANSPLSPNQKGECLFS